MTTEQVAIDRDGLRKATRHGLMGAFWLAVLTIGAFIVFTIGDGEAWLLWGLLPFVLLKGWIILDTFMHVRALWGSDH